MYFYLYSLGCKVNSYELDALRQSLLKAGHLAEKNIAETDIVVINTCSVTATADQKSRQTLRRLFSASPNAIHIVMGCYSERHALEAHSLGADIVLGTKHRTKILEYIDSFKENRQAIIDVDNKRETIYEELGSASYSENARAYLKIQDGCNKFCSYCLIPYVRGASRSRQKENILAEAKALYEAGYQEIILTGIESGCYGLDFSNHYRLGELIADIFKEIPLLPRLRLSSLDASEIDETILEDFRRFPALVSHLHLSLQSGSRSVLTRMRRHYTPEEFLEVVDKIRVIRPDIAITTDVIAGFPLESDEEWQETMIFCKKVAFAQIHVFPYSSRLGTPASRERQIDPLIKNRRVHELLSLSKELRGRYRSSFFGTKKEVLFESYDKKSGLAYGHTDNYLLVKLPSSRPLHGEMLPIIYSRENAAD